MDTEYMTEELDGEENQDTTAEKKKFKLTDKFDYKKGDVSEE